MILLPISFLKSGSNSWALAFNASIVVSSLVMLFNQYKKFSLGGGGVDVFYGTVPIRNVQLTFVASVKIKIVQRTAMSHRESDKYL